MSSSKPKVIKSFEKLDKELQEQIKLAYPYGFSDSLITFSKPDGSLVSALPFETDEKFYLLKMSENEAVKLIAMDDDYDSEGNLKDDARAEYEEKHVDIEEIADDVADLSSEE